MVFRNILHCLLSTPIKTNVNLELAAMIILELRKASLVSKAFNERGLLKFLIELSGFNVVIEKDITKLFQLSVKDFPFAEST